MIFLKQLAGTSISTQFLARSLRNLSISSTSNPSTPRRSFLEGKLEELELRLQPMITRQSNSLVKDIGINCPLWRKKEIFELPLTNKIIENPTISKVIEEIVDIDKVLDLPSQNSNGDDDAGKQAAKNGMIMVRRRKMRKHKLRKLRKKMKYEWAKVRQRREWRKEKAFQAELTVQIREAEKFSAEEFVSEKIRKATETPIPRFWKHRRLPQFLIKQLMAREEEKRQIKKLQLWEKYGEQ